MDHVIAPPELNAWEGFQAYRIENSMEQRLFPGAEVEHAGRVWRVERALGPDAMLLRNESGETVSVNPTRITLVTCKDAVFNNRHNSELTFSEKQWADAEHRRDVVIALTRHPARTQAYVDAAAKELGIKRRRLWAIMRNAETTGFEITQFLPTLKGPRAKRLNPSIEAIIDQSIEQYFARNSKPEITILHNEIAQRCRSAALKPPAYGTVQARVRDADQIWLTRRRKGLKEARKLQLLVGSHPGAVAPWDRVQIDSTPCDIRLVSDADRMIVGRATGTFAIDIYSRTILGFSVSLESASTLTVATCLENACHPKDDWLALRDLGRLHWPVYGKPSILEYDQGSENEARGIQRGLKLHGIKGKIRPKGKPSHHGHIERVIGTLMKKIHQLPGTTFSNINERGEIEPDKLACMTLGELEHALAFIIDSYNHTTHATTGERPIERYLSYYRHPDLPDSERIPHRVRENFVLDFLPFERRELKRTGIRLFWVDYSSVDLLPLWSRDNQKPIQRVVVYDPRSLKQIWVADELTGDYIVAPYRTPYPDMTLAENVAAREKFRDMKKQDRTEQRLFDNLTKIQEIVAKAKSTTSRRKAERTLQARKSFVELEHKITVTPLQDDNAAMQGQNPPAWAGMSIIPFSDVDSL
jgi:putative transposase